jgi:hypothetical protein
MDKNLEDMEKGELIELVRQLLLELSELKTRLNQNSTNSSTLPSADPYHKPTSLCPKSDKKNSGQPGHVGHGLSLPHFPNQMITLEPENCVHCGGDLIGHHRLCYQYPLPN